MACESKKISELTEACLVNPNDILPIVQDGTNKYVKVKDLLKGKCGDDTQEDDCCCSKALSKAVTALDFSRTAMDLANKAFDKACQVDTKLGALEQRVTELELIICNIQSQITQIFNRFDQLEDGLTVTVVTTSDPLLELDKYEIKLGGITKGIIPVLRPTNNINLNGQGRPADAWQVRLALDGLKSEVTKNLTFVSGKFNSPGLTYNGTSPVSVNIPTALSLLDNDGNFLEGVRGHDGNLVQVVNHIAELGPLPTATSTVLGGIKVGYSQSGKKYPVKLDSNNKAYIDLTNLPTGAENLDDLGDVELTSPLDGDILYYDGTLNKWVNQSLKDLVESIIDCEYIQECISNFKVTPATHNKTATQTTAEYTVEATGAWTVAKESDPSNFITNFTTSGNDNGTITVTFGNNATLNTRTAKFIVTETATGRTARITINQSGVTPTVDRTITYNISGGQTNSIKVNNEAVSNGGQKTAPDGSNYTASIVSNDPGYKISSVTPSVGTYNTGTGTLTINPITADATVQVVLELIPAETHKLTYVIPNHDDKIDIVPGDVYIPDGVAYTEDLAGAINDPEYEVTGVNILPSSNGTYINGELTISDTVTTDTVVTINIASTSLSVNPDDITVPLGLTTNTSITVTTTCTGGEYNARNLPTGITAVKQAGGFEVTVQSSVSIGQYLFEVYDECGNTATVTINVEEITPYFDEDTNNCAYFSPRGVPVDAIDYDHDHIEHFNHARDGFINGNVYNNGIVTYIDSSDLSWNMTIPYSSPNGINDLLVYYLNEYITDGYGTSSPAVHTTYLDGAQATAANVSLIDNQNDTITVKMLLTSTVPTDLVTSGYGPVNILDFGSGDRSMAFSSRKVGFAVKVLPTNPEYNKYPVVGSGPSAYHYILSTTIYLDNYLYDDINNQSVNVSTGGSTDTLFRVPYVLPITAFGFTTLSGTSSWIKDIVYPQTISGTGYYYGKFNSDAGPAEVGELQYLFSWTGGSAGSINKVVEVNRQ